jgi:hypothetical protein
MRVWKIPTISLPNWKQHSCACARTSDSIAVGGTSTLYYRVWQDFFMGSRLSAYRDLIGGLKQHGYRFCTMAEFVRAVDRGDRFSAPVCLLRNDVDSDPLGAAKMFDCDRDAGIRATYYFRLATLDPGLAARLTAHGAEVGYHFEEIATVAKRLALRSKMEIEQRMDLIRDEFRSNLRKFRERSGVAVRTVASHGDFANRRLGVPNQALLTPALLAELSLLADAYDQRVHAGLSARFTDCPPPQWWKPADPMRALGAKSATVSILVHPRQWTCSPSVNLRLAIARIGEEASWRLRSLRSRNRAPHIPNSAVP